MYSVLKYFEYSVLSKIVSNYARILYTFFACYKKSEPHLAYAARTSCEKLAVVISAVPLQ